MNYNIYINSNDKMSGKNNNATFQINWNDFLPRNYKYYNVTFSFQTAPGYYKDDTTNSKFYSNCEINCDFYTTTFSFDTATKANSLTLGYAQRDIQTASGNNLKNTFACFYNYNCPKTIVRPENNLITISIYNMAAIVGGTNTLLFDTDNATSPTVASDMTAWSMIMSFSPVKYSIVPEMYNV